MANHTLQSPSPNCPLNASQASSNPEHSSGDHKTLYYEGKTLARSNHYLEALACLEHSLTIKPCFPYAWILRGEVLTQLDRYEDALASFEKALAIQPDNQTAQLYKGIALHHLGRYKQAYTSYDRLLGAQPPSFWQEGIHMFKSLFGMRWLPI